MTYDWVISHAAAWAPGRTIQQCPRFPSRHSFTVDHLTKDKTGQRLLKQMSASIWNLLFMPREVKHAKDFTIKRFHEFFLQRNNDKCTTQATDKYRHSWLEAAVIIIIIIKFISQHDLVTQNHNNKKDKRNNWLNGQHRMKPLTCGH